MKLSLVLSTLCLVALLAPSQQQVVINASASTDDNNDFVTSLSTILVDHITKKVRNLIDIFDVKLRFIRFLRSLYTDDNLELARRGINLAVRFGTWVLSFLPQTADNPGSVLLSLIFPQLDLNTNLEAIYGSASDKVENNDDVTESNAVRMEMEPPVQEAKPEINPNVNLDKLNSDDRNLVSENFDRVIGLSDIIFANGQGQKSNNK